MFGEDAASAARKLTNTEDLDNMLLQDPVQPSPDSIVDINGGWFTEQFINFDWLNSPWEQSGFNF